MSEHKKLQCEVLVFDLQNGGIHCIENLGAVNEQMRSWQPGFRPRLAEQSNCANVTRKKRCVARKNAACKPAKPGTR
jgi:hypothetical protein